MASSHLNILYLLFLTYITNKCVGEKLPSISNISENLTAYIGERVELECSVRDYSDKYPILWMKTNGAGVSDSAFPLPVSIDNALITKDARFSLGHNYTTSTYKLKIDDVQEKDAGTYGCVILFTVSNRLFAEIEVQVKQPSNTHISNTREEQEILNI